MKDKIFVYRRTESGVLHLIEEYDSPADFALRYAEGEVKRDFREDDSERVVDVDRYGRGSFLNLKVFAKVAYNGKDKLLPVSQLVGYCRNHHGINVWERRWMMRRNGRKKSAYGWFRRPKTTQEMRWAHAWDDEEDCPPPRGRRQGHNLPNAWDDYYAHGEKSWKKQSKRKRQWKEKK